MPPKRRITRSAAAAAVAAAARVPVTAASTPIRKQTMTRRMTTKAAKETEQQLPSRKHGAIFDSYSDGGSEATWMAQRESCAQETPEFGDPDRTLVNIGDSNQGEGEDEESDGDAGFPNVPKSLFSTPPSPKLLRNGFVDLAMLPLSRKLMDPFEYGSGFQRDCIAPKSTTGRSSKRKEPARAANGRNGKTRLEETKSDGSNFSIERVSAEKIMKNKRAGNPKRDDSTLTAKFLDSLDLESSNTIQTLIDSSKSYLDRQKEALSKFWSDETKMLAILNKSVCEFESQALEKRGVFRALYSEIESELHTSRDGARTAIEKIHKISSDFKEAARERIERDFAESKIRAAVEQLFSA
ncbi:hypothetical protein HDU84_005699 [Entophlyctis sp. JEL0112]|nr:hypothetical protein HDU84_005699 [Entophlyctis sp. JEL0112]